MSSFVSSLGAASLPRKGVDAQSRFEGEYQRPAQPSPNLRRHSYRHVWPSAYSADKLAQMTIEGDLRLHDQIIAGRADVAVLR